VTTAATAGGRRGGEVETSGRGEPLWCGTTDRIISPPIRYFRLFLRGSGGEGPRGQLAAAISRTLLGRDPVLAAQALGVVGQLVRSPWVLESQLSLEPAARARVDHAGVV
jgi:hypothetical protein